jgi:hypothetical protein
MVSNGCAVLLTAKKENADWFIRRKAISDLNLNGTVGKKSSLIIRIKLT